MRTAILLLCSCVLAAQTSTITGTFTDAAGDRLSGSCSIQAVGPFSAATGWRVIGAQMTVKFTNGQFFATVAPTDSATPSGQYYKVTCAVPDQTMNGRAIAKFSWGPRYWLVPTNAAAMDVGTVELTAPPSSPSWTVLWQQMAQNGAQVGQAPLWTGSAWQPGFMSATLPFTVPPQDGQYMRWNAAQSAWQPVSFVDQEVLGGLINGSNPVFSLSNAPSPPGGLVLFRNGLAQMAGQDYTLAGNAITFVTAAIPQSGDTLLAWYRY
jgi:hypothetical protein